MMIKLMFAALGAMLIPGAAVAQDGRPQSQIDAVVRCLDVAAVEERVRCYDQAAATLRDGARRGEIVERAPPTPSQVQARVASASAAGGRWELVLDNGQTWRTQEMQDGGPPPAGVPVRIERNLIGSYWMRVRGGGRIRVARVQ